MTEKLVKVAEVCDLLDVKPARVYELCREDKDFPFILIGQRQYRFSKTALENWIENGGSRQSEVNDND
jgi:excisionase family DNA binding protein